MVRVVWDAAGALRAILAPPFRLAALKIMTVTLALLVLSVATLHHWLSGLVVPPSPWLATPLALVEGLGLVLGSVFLVAPASALVAGFFVDDLAAQLETSLKPQGPPGRALPAGAALWLSLRFALLSLGVAVVALALLLVPGINAIAFLGANAYLSGRQYFDFAALRFRPPAEVATLRQAHAGRVFLAGLCIALFLAVPVLNLFTPLFGTALMVRVHKRLGPAAAARA